MEKPLQAPTDETSTRLSLSLETNETKIDEILSQPDTYIGSMEEGREYKVESHVDKYRFFVLVTRNMWVHAYRNSGAGAIVKRSVTFVPGLYKIFDEILTNAVLKKRGNPSMKRLDINIDKEKNIFRVWNDGKGVAVEDTSCGLKLCNIFSNWLTVETTCEESGILYKKTWRDNARYSEVPQRTSFTGRDYTCIAFAPDLARFNVEELDRDIVALIRRRAHDIAGSLRGVKVYFNRRKIPISSFCDYVEFHLKSTEDEFAEKSGKDVRRFVYSRVGEEWEVCVAASASGFQQVSLVNSIATTRGGTHVEYLTRKLVNKVATAMKEKIKGGMELDRVKSHIWIFANCFVENPTFDSPTKEYMTLPATSFGSSCTFDEDFVKKVVDLIVQSPEVSSQADLCRNVAATTNQTKRKEISAVVDASSPGENENSTLILTDRNSGKALVLSGLSVVGRNHFGFYHISGKLPNVFEATDAQIEADADIKKIVNIVGLEYGRDYSSVADLEALRYRRLMIMTDQDEVGTNMKGILIRFLHSKWPLLLRLPFLEQFITPRVKVFNGPNEKTFYSLSKFYEWKAKTLDSKSWRVKYYKGLGTSTPKEAKEYFQDLERHRVKFSFSGSIDEAAMTLAFGKENFAWQKLWINDWLAQKKKKRQVGENESFFLENEVDQLTFSDFVNKELVQFANADNERFIPSLVDGLKPCQRKVIFTCFKRKDRDVSNVSQLAGSVADLTACHDSSTSLENAIIGLAQNFVGSNNINLLEPVGQFGTRLRGGKDVASSRNIFTALSPLARLIISPLDDPSLTYLRDDNLGIEPEWYCPVLPLVLVNGSEGIGRKFSSFVPSYDIRKIVANIQRMLDGLEPVAMAPSYKGFTGTIRQDDKHNFVSFGKIARLDDTHLEITELPIGTWTDLYKEEVLECMLYDSNQIEQLISDYTEHHTDTSVRFIVTMTKANMDTCEKEGFHDTFQLKSSLATNNLVLFDSKGCLKKYSNVLEILKEFFDLRLEQYAMRKRWLQRQLKAEVEKLTNQARFIDEKSKGKVIVENKKRREIIAWLSARDYASDPVEACKETVVSSPEADVQAEDEDHTKTARGLKFDYLLGLSLTKEGTAELLAKRNVKVSELRSVSEKTPETMWNDDLEKVLEELEKVEQNEEHVRSIPTTQPSLEEEPGLSAASLSVGKDSATKRKHVATMEENDSDVVLAEEEKSKETASKKVEVRAKRPRGRPPKQLPGSRYRDLEKDDADFLPWPPKKKKTASSSAAKRKKTSVPASDFYSEVSPPLKRSPRLAEKCDKKADDEMGSNNQLELLEFSTVAEEIVNTENTESGASAVKSPIFDDEPFD